MIMFQANIELWLVKFVWYFQLLFFWLLIIFYVHIKKRGKAAILNPHSRQNKGKYMFQ
jgi:preprotein translocase subunit SecG